MSLPDPSTFIAAGASAEVYRLEGGFVLKLFHAGIDPSIIDREFETARAIHATGLPVAQATGLREADGRRGIVYTEISGPNLLAYIQRHPHRAGWALREMAHFQQRIATRPVPLLRSRKAILAEDIEASATGEGGTGEGAVGPVLRAAALERLEQLVEGDGLSHGDLHPANLIVTGDGLAAIDWSKAARGAAAADVVRTEMLLRFAPGQFGGRVEAAVRDAAAAYYVRRYRAQAGIGEEGLAAWRPLVALAWARHRLPARDAAFARYLDEALRVAGLPAAGR